MPKLRSRDGGGSWALIQEGGLIVPVSRGAFVSMSPRAQPIRDAGTLRAGGALRGGCRQIWLLGAGLLSGRRF